MYPLSNGIWHLLPLLSLWLAWLPGTLSQGSGGLYDPDPEQEAELLEGQQGLCQPVTTPLCKDLPYNFTLFPNLVGHDTQDEASLELHQFSPLVQIQCSPYFQLFVCSLYIPICTGLEEPIPPCRSLCKKSKMGCLPIMLQFGFPWPEKLECDSLPEVSSEQLCVHEDTEGTTEASLTLPQETAQDLITTIPDATSIIPSELDPPPAACQPFHTPMCKYILPYNTSMMPNILGHEDNTQAVIELHEWRILVNSGCNLWLGQFLCRIYFPKCSDSLSNHSTSQLPCKDVCLQVQEDCRKVMDQFSFPWPLENGCESFPSSGQCISISDIDISVLEDAESRAVARGCTRLDTGFCEDMPYNYTKFPNTFGHRKFSEFSKYIDEFSKFTEIGCDVDIVDIICHSFLSPCPSELNEVGSQDNKIESSLTFCDKITRSCWRVLAEGRNLPQSSFCDFTTVKVNNAQSRGGSTLALLECLFILMVITIFKS